MGLILYMQTDGLGDRFVATFWVAFGDFPVIVATNQLPPKLCWIYLLEVTFVHSSDNWSDVCRVILLELQEKLNFCVLYLNKRKSWVNYNNSLRISEKNVDYWSDFA